MTSRLAFHIFTNIDDKMSDLFAKMCNEHSHLGLDIDIFVDCYGGLLWETYSIYKTLKTYKELNPAAKIRTFVYSKAYSASMWFVMIADELYCSDYARFGPIDSQMVLKDSINVNKRNRECLSNVKTSDGNLEYLVYEHKSFNDWYEKYFMDYLTNRPKYSENAERIFQLLHNPISHYVTYTIKDLENVGITCMGPIPKDLISLFKTKTLEGKTCAFIYPPLPPKEEKGPLFFGIGVICMLTLICLNNKGS